MTKRAWLFMVSLVGLAVSAALLIFIIPSLFQSGEPGRVWAIGMLACLVVVFAVGTRCWRPSASISDGE